MHIGTVRFSEMFALISADDFLQGMLSNDVGLEVGGQSCKWFAYRSFGYGRQPYELRR